MKRQLLISAAPLLVLLLFVSATFSQSMFGEQMIISKIEGSGPNIVQTADLDEDGDPDVIAASYLDDRIVWYENDGNGNFSQPLVITDTADDVQAVHVVDVDNDGDLDVFAAAWADASIIWFENQGGGFFSETKIINDKAYGANGVYTADMDSDGDLDVVSTSFNDKKVVWYQNTGDQVFSEAKVLGLVEGIWAMFTADVDGDGDPDVITASKTAGTVLWHENIGMEDEDLKLAEEPNTIITYDQPGNCKLFPFDMDQDGDIDILAAVENANRIEWYESSGSGNFRTRAVTDSAFGAKAAHAADLDKDGDMDVLSSSDSEAYDDDLVAWYENTGNKTFSFIKTISEDVRGPQSVAAADFDGDGFNDVVVASTGKNEIVWFENLSVDTRVDEQGSAPGSFALDQNYPNPFNPATVIHYTLPKTSQVTVNIYNSLGQLIKTLVNTEQNAGQYSVRWNGLSESGQTVSNGIYYYSIHADGFSETKKMLLLK